MFHKLGPLACSAGWFLDGVSCYKANDKDTWKEAQKDCIASGGDLVKIYNARDGKHRSLIYFMEIIGLKKIKIDVSIESQSRLKVGGIHNNKRFQSGCGKITSSLLKA